MAGTSWQDVKLRSSCPSCFLSWGQGETLSFCSEQTPFVMGVGETMRWVGGEAPRSLGDQAASTLSPCSSCTGGAGTCPLQSTWSSYT